GEMRGDALAGLPNRTLRGMSGGWSPRTISGPPHNPTRTVGQMSRDMYALHERDSRNDGREAIVASRRLNRLTRPWRTGQASFSHFLDFLLDRLGPDVIALGTEVQVVRHDRPGQVAFLVEELVADVEVLDILAVVELGNDLVDLLDLR